MEYKLERITPNGYKNIQKLKHRSMGYVQKLSDIEKKYDTTLFRKKDIGFFAVDENDNPAAYYGVFPMVATYMGNDYYVAQSGDTMTDPNHRQKGLFIKLALKTYELCKAEELSFVFGFPNENSYPGFKNKLSWEFVGNMQEFSFSGSNFPLCEVAKKYPIFSGLYNSLLKIRISKIQLPINQSSIVEFSHRSDQLYIKKDLSFYQYKMRSGGKFIIKLEGFTMFIKANTHLFIGDVGFFERSKTPQFIKTVEKLARLVLSKKALLLLNKNHWLYNYLQAEFEPKESLPIGFYKISQDFPFENVVISMSDYDTF
jgi:hypothetical protein